MFTDGRTSGRTDEQTTDGCQAHRINPETFRSGGKKDIALLNIMLKSQSAHLYIGS